MKSSMFLIKNYIFISFLSLFILLPATLFASWVLPSKSFTMESYNGGTQNWQIIQSKKGWIYFANNDGLLEYDGIDWRIFELDNKSNVRAVELDDNGDIYIGGFNEFGCLKAEKNGKLNYHNISANIPDSIHSFNEVWSIHKVGNSVYFHTVEGYYIKDSDGNIDFAPFHETVSKSCVSNGNIYCTTPFGLYLFSKNRYIPLLTSKKLPKSEICALTPYKNDKILISTKFEGIYLFDGNKLTPFHTAVDDKIKKNHLFSLAITDDYIAYGTVRDGLYITDIDGKNPEYLNLSNGLSNNTVLSLLFDSNDRLWVGLDNGIDRVVVNPSYRNLIDSKESRFTGYCSKVYKSNIYYGTNQGVLYAKYNDNFIQDREKLSIVKNSEGQIWKLTEIDDVLYCCHVRGLYALSGKDRLVPIYEKKGVWNIEKIAPNTFLMATHEGFVVVKGDNNGRISSRSKFVEVDGFSKSTRDYVFHRPSKTIWIRGMYGLKKMEFNADFSKLTGTEIYSEIESTSKFIILEGRYYVYSQNGTYKITEAGGFIESDELSPIIGDKIDYLSITVDKYNRVWTLKDGRLQMVEKSKSNQGYISKLVATFPSERYIVKEYIDKNYIDKNYAIINNVYGFALVNSEWSSKKDSEVKPLVKEIYTTNLKDSLVYSEGYCDIENQITLPYSSNSIKIMFGVTSAGVSDWKFSCVMKGVEDEWSEWKNVYYKDYTALHEGRYTFKVRLLDRNNNINEHEVLITILPPWYRHPISYVIYALIVVMIIAAIFRVSKRKLIREKKKIEQDKEVEIRLQQERHSLEMVKSESEIMRLKNENLESELKSKSAELNNLLISRLDKNDIITTVKGDLTRIHSEIAKNKNENATKRIMALQKKLDDKLVDNIDWRSFEENFNVTNDNFVKKLNDNFKWMTIHERRLCIYIKIGLQNKEIAPLLNLSVRGVEMMRYRVRKKMEIERSENFYEFLQSI